MGNKGLVQRLARLEKRSSGVSERAYARRLRDLDKHLQAARGQPSPALALHRSNARTVLFQLEALGRVDRATLDDKAFLPLHASFKAFEDGLGAVDFHDAILKKLTADSSNPTNADLRAYFTGRRSEACQWVERWLERQGWWPEGDEGEASDAMDDLLDVLEDVSWPGPRKEKRQIAEYFADCATSIHERLVKHAFDFTDLEEGVHELRRRLRWLSIIPASIDGLFVRDEDAKIEGPLAAYCTPAVVASPFNRFPRREDVPDPIVMDSPSFLAVSWAIAEIGVIKDVAQTGEAIARAVIDLGETSKAAAARVRQLLGHAPISHDKIARDVEPIAARFVKDEVLVRLGASAAKQGRDA